MAGKFVLKKGSSGKYRVVILLAGRSHQASPHEPKGHPGRCRR
jgi:hypothetical protein